MKTFNILILLTFILIMGGCDESKKVVDDTGNFILDGEYFITEITNITLQSDTLTLSLTDLDKSVLGHAGCNSFFGNYSIDLYELSFGQFAITERYCEEPIMTVERAYLRALHQTGSYALKGNSLTLFSKVDKRILLKAKKKTK